METLISFPGEIQDLAAWKSISNGARQKIKKTYDEIMEMR